MDEYINREDLRDALYDADAITMEGIKILNLFQAADVALVRHGRWVLVDNDEEQFFFCSECENKEYWESEYCPACGAKMDLED
jgi:hypothetical protein